MDKMKEEIKYFKAWILFFLVATVGGFIIGALVGGVIGFIMGAMRYPLETITILCKEIGLCIAVPISYLCFKWSVGKYIVPQLVSKHPLNPMIPSGKMTGTPTNT
jgi:ABC-type nitrate/sulfonate/bicarbonate transport system permease component